MAAPEPALGAWHAARDACRRVDTYSAELHVSGRVGATHQKIGGTLRGAVTRGDQIRLEASTPVLGSPIFVLAGRAEAATLVLVHDRRVVYAPAADIVEALTGLRLAPGELAAVLSGCVTAADTASDGTRLGETLAVTTGDGRAFLQRVNGAWRIVGGERPGLLIGYADRDAPDGFPRLVRINSPPGARQPLLLTIRTEQVIVNSSSLRESAFHVDVPAGVTPLTLDELRAAGPLGEKGGAP